MDVQEKTLRAIGTPPALPGRTDAMPRRTLHRVETAAMDVQVALQTPAGVAHGHLLNLSAGGCSVRVPLPLTLILDAGISFDVMLPSSAGELRCIGEIVGLEVGKGSVIMRLRFGSLAAEARRDLLTLIGELVTRDFQLRHTGGNRAWRPRRRE